MFAAVPRELEYEFLSLGRKEKRGNKSSESFHSFSDDDRNVKKGKIYPKCLRRTQQ